MHNDSNISMNEHMDYWVSTINHTTGLSTKTHASVVKRGRGDGQEEEEGRGRGREGKRKGGEEGGKKEEMIGEVGRRQSRRRRVYECFTLIFT